MAYSGTPWSGQPVKWNWVTFLAADPESCGGSIWCKDWGLHIQGLIHGFAKCCVSGILFVSSEVSERFGLLSN